MPYVMRLPTKADLYAKRWNLQPKVRKLRKNLVEHAKSRVWPRNQMNCGCLQTAIRISRQLKKV